ncbi:hypothetical protein [Bifidobacterium sp. ESL0732]|uniref:hypothetical protein n=1 Tax=Bifidobacterium sp. ESL0732 TaxID=2983222 RepID=UPI0023F91E8B|nr:hypothetical protein [Bifidobacterium sp. ESL0732]WEV63884.1 hypothetical protein OZX70_08145 [Bifidobacterium sp. ESL0732]
MESLQTIWNFIKSLPKPVNFILLVLFILIYLARRIIPQITDFLKSSGINLSLPNSTKGLNERIKMLDELNTTLTLPGDAEVLSRRKRPLQEKLEKQQLRKQFSEYVKDRLYSKDPAIEKLFKPQKLYAFCIYALFCGTATLLVSSLIFFLVPCHPKTKNWVPFAIFFAGMGIFLIGIMACICIQKLWVRNQISFTFEYYFSPIIDTVGAFAIKSEDSAFDHMRAIRKTHNPKHPRIATWSGALAGTGTAGFIASAYLLRLFPNNLPLTLVNFISTLMWCYGAVYLSISCIRCLSRTANTAY